jgi:hypothetical protein
VANRRSERRQPELTLILRRGEDVDEVGGLQLLARLLTVEDDIVLTAQGRRPAHPRIADGA